MRLRLTIGAAILVSAVWCMPAQASCAPKDVNSANAAKCAQTTDPGLCNTNTECTWTEPEVPEAAKPKPAPANNKEIISLKNPLSANDIPTIVGNAIKVAMGIMGSLALVVFVYGGFRWLTAAGNSESIETGTSAMVWATIGIFIIFSSYAILQLVFNAIGVQNRGTSTPVTGGVGGAYCLVHCTALNACVDISAKSGDELVSMGETCGFDQFRTEKGTCAGVADCKK